MVNELEGFTSHTTIKVYDPASIHAMYVAWFPRSHVTGWLSAS